MTFFKSEKPAAPFFFEKLKSLIVLILQQFVKASIISEASTNTFKLINLKLEGNNVLPLHETDVGLGAKSVLKRLKRVDKPEDRKFCANAQIFLIEMMKKIFEDSPLKYKLTKGISSLSSTQICSLKPEFMKKKFSLQELLQECNHLSTADGDKSTRQYNSLIENKGFLEEAKKFSIQDDRLDGFYAQIFVFVGLENFRMVLILSDDNIHMESGFSANGEILMENMLTVVAQHLVY